MTRTHVREVVLDTSHFTPIQLNTRFVMQCCMNGWAGWARDHLTPFHKLIRDEGFGLAVVDFHVSWSRRFGFFDTDTVEVRTSIGIRSDAQLLRGEVQIHGRGREVVRSVVLMRPLRLTDATLAAQPGAAMESIVERFQPEEVVETPPRDRVDTIAADLSASGEVVAQGWRNFR